MKLSVNNVASLLKNNESYFKDFKKRPFFDMITNGELQENEKKRQRFFNYMQIFADHFQTMMQTRQAACRDEKFYPTFLTHFIDEFGHNQLFKNRRKVSELWDPTLVAISTWFVHQMQVLDNLEKMALMHLVLEKTGDYYHTTAIKPLEQYIQSEYYKIHAEHDADHVAMAIDLLPGYPDFVYKRLDKLLKEGWFMMYTLVDRVTELVRQEDK